MAKKTSINISWDAQEHIHYDNNIWWYMWLVVISLVLIGVSILLKTWTFVVLIVLSVIALIIYVARPPRQIHYVLDEEGLDEDGRKHLYDDFRSFGILKDGTNFSIVLTPRKRFSPRITIFFPSSKGEEIVDAFGARLPMEDVKMDVIDRIIKFLRI